MHQSIDNCTRNMGSDGNIVSIEKRRLVEELHAPARKNFPRRYVIVRGYDDLWQVISLRCIHTHISTKVTITFSASLTCVGHTAQE